MNYVRDSQLNLFQRLDHGPFAYSDGVEVEGRLFDIVSRATDRSTFSSELITSITDWPSEYHLSRARHCLLRPLNIQPGSKVLELGCGCGAITRYLGEIGAEVVAVEGSLSRARVAAERCRDLPNVRIFVDDLLRFETDERFDYVLLIGVLEYAAVFSTQENPFAHYLQSVTRFLARGGRVVVAIENKLGLKYFNGCAEDHVGIPFFGIQDLYGNQSARTFGRVDLKAQLAAAGLPNTSFYYPFPDYKLPTVVLSEAALSDPAFDAIDLLARSHARDYGGSPFRSFDDALAFSVLHDNRLLADLSNSFLVVATAEPSADNTSAELAAAYSVYRAPEFCVQTRFMRCATNIQVVKELLTSAPVHPVLLPDGTTITHRMDGSVYRPGRQLLWRLLKARARSGDLTAVVEALRPWMEFLLQHARVPSAYLGDVSGGPVNLAAYKLPGNFLDCTPFNVLDAGNELFPIDLEWQSDREVSLGWLVTRGILWSMNFGLLFSGPPPTVADLVENAAKSCGLAVRRSEIQRWLDHESWFLTVVVGGAMEALQTSQTAAGILTFHREITSLKEQKLAVDQLLMAREIELADRRKQIVSRDKWSSEQLASRDKRISDLDRMLQGHTESLKNALSDKEQLRREVEDLTLQYDRLRATVARSDRRISEILSSVSWRLTAPVRALKKLTISYHRKARQLEKDRTLLAQSRLFDPNWYLMHYPDVAISRADPITHYLQHGALEGRDPSEHFSTTWYFEHNSDVVSAVINPLVHYLRYGLAEGREPKPGQVIVKKPGFFAHEVFDYITVPLDAATLPSKVAIGVSSLGNFFMTEIARMLEDAFKQLGVSTRLFSESDCTVSSTSETVIIVAPHEFFCLGNGPAAFQRIKDHPGLVMLNTEQSQTQWFGEAEKYLPAATTVVDINHDSAKHLLHKGYNSFFLPLGYSDYIDRTFGDSALPERELFWHLARPVRETLPVGYGERPIDILFVGTSSPRRQDFFATNAGFFAHRNSFIYIPEGDTPFLSNTTRTIDFPTLLALARRSKVLLNIHRDENQYLEWQRIATLGIMQKTIVVTDLCQAGPCILPGLDYLEAPLSGVPELCDLVLNRVDDMSAMAEAAYNRLKTDYPMAKLVGQCWTAIVKYTNMKSC